MGKRITSETGRECLFTKKSVENALPILEEMIEGDIEVRDGELGHYLTEEQYQMASGYLMKLDVLYGFEYCRERYDAGRYRVINGFDPAGEKKIFVIYNSMTILFLMLIRNYMHSCLALD